MGTRKHKRTKAERKIARILKRAQRQKDFLAERLKKELAFTKVLPQPHQEGDRCWKCGTVLVYHKTKRTKHKPGQAYAYRGYLHCSGCKRNYFFDRDKYWLVAPEPKRVPLRSLEHRGDVAIQNDRPRTIVDLMHERERNMPRLIKRHGD